MRNVTSSWSIPTYVGEAVGLKVGLRVGLDVVGERVGLRVGLDVVGDREGDRVGVLVLGLCVGDFVGDRVGVKVGTMQSASTVSAIRLATFQLIVENEFEDTGREVMGKGGLLYAAQKSVLLLRTQSRVPDEYPPLK